MYIIGYLVLLSSALVFLAFENIVSICFLPQKEGSDELNIIYIYIGELGLFCNSICTLQYQCSMIAQSVMKKGFGV